jgi:outer membrane protein TolC
MANSSTQNISSLFFLCGLTFFLLLLPLDVPTASGSSNQGTDRQITSPSTATEKPSFAFTGELPSSPELNNFSVTDAAIEEPEIITLYTNLFQASASGAPDIRIAATQQRQKAAERYTALAERLAPAITADVSQVHEIDKNKTDDRTTSSPDEEPSDPIAYEDSRNHSDWKLDMEMPLYRRKTILNLDVAQIEKNIADNRLQIALQELDVKLRELLSNYLVASYRLLNLQNSVTLSREHVNRIQRGYELRDQTRLQLLRAQANLKELEARRDLNEQQRDAAFRAILDYTGLHREEALFVQLFSLTKSEHSTAGCINSLADIDTGFEQLRSFIEEASDPDLRNQFRRQSLLYTTIDLDHQLAVLKAQRYTQNNWPELTVAGDYYRKQDTAFSEFEGEGEVALIFSVPVFTGGTIISNHKARSMAERVADVSRQTQLRRTVHTIENHRKLIQNLRKVYTTQQINLAQQEEIVRLSLKSYQIKQTSMQDLLTSKNRLIDAKNALMETTSTLGTLYRQFAWELGTPFPAPDIATLRSKETTQ